VQVASIPSRALFGIEAVEVNVEAHLSSGLPSFAIVGLPETAVKESKERVRSALINSGLSFPMERITVNLAPADLPKAGGRDDLAIAVAILIASDQLSSSESGQLVELFKGCEMVGELALGGELRPVPGVVQAVLAAQNAARPIIVPAANHAELRIVGYPLARGVASLTALLSLVTQLAHAHRTLREPDSSAGQGSSIPIGEHTADQPNECSRGTLKGALKGTLKGTTKGASKGTTKGTSQKGEELSANGDTIFATQEPKFPPIRGQARALRALEIAAAGGHNLLMLGPPGSGKTLLATTLNKLLPNMSRKETLEVASIRSAAVGSLAQGLALDLSSAYIERPLRAPHHSATTPSLVGGGGDATPGEITLAHRGVLFLDELAEFKATVLDALREPLEARVITISRARYRVQFPANFQLVAAMNPCPCGYASDPQRECRCTPDRIRNYLGKVSGPLLDRFDQVIEVPALSHAELLAVGRVQSAEQEEAEARVWQQRRTRIARCRRRQIERQGVLNCELSAAELEEACGLSDARKRKLAALFEQLKVSARGAHRLLRLARTIADYDAESVADIDSVPATKLDSDFEGGPTRGPDGVRGGVLNSALNTLNSRLENEIGSEIKSRITGRGFIAKEGGKEGDRESERESERESNRKCGRESSVEVEDAHFLEAASYRRRSQ
jgi:magnesium chelatase family protein